MKTEMKLASKDWKKSYSIHQGTPNEAIRAALESLKTYQFQTNQPTPSLESEEDLRYSSSLGFFSEITFDDVETKNLDIEDLSTCYELN